MIIQLESQPFKTSFLKATPDNVMLQRQYFSHITIRQWCTCIYLYIEITKHNICNGMTLVFLDRCLKYHRLLKYEEVSAQNKGRKYSLI